MAGLTSRFRFNKFGGGTPGTIADNAQKFTGADRDAIDRLLAQTERHDHHLRAPSATLATAPTAELASDDGVLVGGETYYYRFSVVGSDGTETVASPEVAVATPEPLVAPGIPELWVDSVSAEGDLAGIYYYALTALRGAEESILGPLGTISVVAPDGAVTIGLPDFGEADGLRIWRMGMNDPGWTRVTTINADDGVTEFVDDGSVPPDPCACDPANLPPTGFNNGVAVYRIEVTLPEDVDLSTASAWRLYRSTVSGQYATASLVHEVVETQDEWDEESPLMRSWSDVGDPLVDGSPLDFEANMAFAPYVFDGGAELPDPNGYPERYPFLLGNELCALVDGQWALVAGGGGGSSAAIPGPTILTSPSGDRFVLTVDDLGALAATPTLLPGPPTAPQNVTVS